MTHGPYNIKLIDVNLWHFPYLRVVPTDIFSIDRPVFLQPLGVVLKSRYHWMCTICTVAKVKNAMPSEGQVLLVAAYVLPPDDNSVDYWQCSIFQRNWRKKLINRTFRTWLIQLNLLYLQQSPFLELKFVDSPPVCVCCVSMKGYRYLYNSCEEELEVYFHQVPLMARY